MSSLAQSPHPFWHASESAGGNTSESQSSITFPFGLKLYFHQDKKKEDAHCLEHPPPYGEIKTCRRSSKATMEAWQATINCLRWCRANCKWISRLERSWPWSSRVSRHSSKANNTFWQVHFRSINCCNWLRSTWTWPLDNLLIALIATEQPEKAGNETGGKSTQCSKKIMNTRIWVLWSQWFK